MVHSVGGLHWHTRSGTGDTGSLGPRRSPQLNGGDDETDEARKHDSASLRHICKSKATRFTEYYLAHGPRAMAAVEASTTGPPELDTSPRIGEWSGARPLFAELGPGHR